MKDADIGLMDSTKRRRTAADEESSEDTFHFIAYVPLNDVLWELDGLKRQPVKLGNTIAKTFIKYAC